MTERQEIVSELQRSNERFRAFMQNATEPIWCVELEQPIAPDLPENVRIISSKS